MAHNLFVAYDLMSPGQNYDAVISSIKELGPHYQFQFSLFYVNTSLSPQKAHAHISNALDVNDRLIVIDAHGAVTSTWDRPPISEINAIWFSS